MRSAVLLVLFGFFVASAACSGSADEPTSDAPDAGAGADDDDDADDDDPRKDAGSEDGQAEASSPRDADTDVEAPSTEVHPDGSSRLRVVAGNLTSGNLQKYQEPGIRILTALVPDVALLQEMNYGNDGPADLRAFVDETFGKGFTYARGSGSIPNAVVSRYPFTGSGEWVDTKVNDRTFVWATIDIPGPVDLLAVSVHLLSSQASARNSEASALLGFIAEKASPGMYVTVGGDFNTAGRDESCMKTFATVFGTGAPYPADTAGGTNTNGPRSKPYDWVIANAVLDGIKAPVKIASHTLPSGLVFDTREYQPLTEVPPAQSGDSAAASMQHMAVVRDFLLPGVAP